MGASSVTEPSPPDARRQATPGSTTRSRGRFFQMHPVKLFWECGVEDISSLGPGPLLRSVPLPINQILEGVTPVPGVKQLVHSI